MRLRRFALVLLVGIMALLTYASSAEEMKNVVREKSPPVEEPSGVHDGPDGFPTIKKQVKPPSYPVWREPEPERRERPPRAGTGRVETEYGDEEIIMLSEPYIEYDPTGGCVEDDDRCAVVARESCNKINNKPLSDKVLFQKRTFVKGVECSWVCPDGELGQCTQEVIRKPKPRKPAPVTLQP